MLLVRSNLSEAQLEASNLSRPEPDVCGTGLGLDHFPFQNIRFHVNKVGGYGRVLMAQGHVMTRSGGLISRGDLLIARHMDLREDSPKAASFSNNGWGSMLIHRRVLTTVVALSLSPSTFFFFFFLVFFES